MAKLLPSFTLFWKKKNFIQVCCYVGLIWTLEAHYTWLHKSGCQSTLVDDIIWLKKSHDADISYCLLFHSLFSEFKDLLPQCTISPQKKMTKCKTKQKKVYEQIQNHTPIYSKLNTHHSTQICMQAKTPNALIHALNEQRKINTFYWRSPSFHFGVLFHPPKHELHACCGILACVMTHHCGKWKMCFVCFLIEKQAWVV